MLLMAFFNRRNNRVYVYVYEDGKQKALPREQTKHLDYQPDTNIRAWIQSEVELRKRNLDQKKPPITDQLQRLLDQYILYLKGRNKSKSTIADHKRCLINYVFPYFLDNDLKNPEAWIFKSVKLLDYLLDKSVSEANILKVNTSLTSFWNWMADEGIVPTGTSIKTRRPIISDKNTPLKYTLTPDDVLSFVAKTTQVEVKLMALLGYFFSLRSQEIFALNKSCFRAGTRAQLLECCKVMGVSGLYNKLAVNITSQRQQDGELKPPKSGSKGWVACFHKDAAIQIVSLINGMDNKSSEDFLIDYKPDWNTRRWRDNGIKDTTLKDLRRASLYHLGHYSNLPIIALKNHARHNKVTTTELYTRRPEEEGMGDEQLLNLDL
jgi:hypothetical protein